MTHPPVNPKFEIRIGEYGAETCVGIRPPLPDDQIKDVLAKIPAHERPAQITPERSKGDEPYTLLKFLHPHFGVYRNDYAMRVVKALESALSNNGTFVRVDKEIESQHSDYELFE